MRVVSCGLNVCLFKMDFLVWKVPLPPPDMLPCAHLPYVAGALKHAGSEQTIVQLRRPWACFGHEGDFSTIPLLIQHVPASALYWVCL